MGIKRWVANKDSTITNAYKANLTGRGSDANMGASDILEVYSIYGQASATSIEQARTLLDFPISSISASRDDGDIPASGSVEFYLRAFNAEHSEPVPKDFTLGITALSESWDEGSGLDMEEYSDRGAGNDMSGSGVTWNYRGFGVFNTEAIHLNGSSDYISITDHADLSFGNSTADTDRSFSLAAWINIDADLDEDTPIIAKWTAANGGTREWILYVTSDGKVYFNLLDESTGAGTDRQTAASTIEAGNWYNIIATYDGSGPAAGSTFDCEGAGVTCRNNNGLKIYINGRLSDDGTANTSTSYVAMENTAQTGSVGRAIISTGTDGKDSYFDGYISDVSVWRDKELSQAEVDEIWGTGCPKNLRHHSAAHKNILWYRFESGIGDIDTAGSNKILDQTTSSNKHHGTTVGTSGDELETVTIGTCNSNSTPIQWVATGSTFASDAGMTITKGFKDGVEDLEIKITDFVEKWLDGSTSHNRGNYGVCVYLTGSYEDGSRNRSYYTKKFFGRESEFFFRRPAIEARWDSSEKDNTNNFYLSSSLATSEDNLNTLYLYNYVKGNLQNIPGLKTDGGVQKIYVTLFEKLGGKGGGIPLPQDDKQSRGVVAAKDKNITGSRISEGVYTASFAYTSSNVSEFYPVWHKGHAAGFQVHSETQYHTGSLVKVKKLNALNANLSAKYSTTIQNLQSVYSNEDVVRFRLFAREKDWKPTTYTIATAEPESTIIEDAFYKVIRLADEHEVVAYNTGSAGGSGPSGTLMSYDMHGNYFDLDMSMLEPDYAYGFKFMYRVNNKYVEQKELHKFRVE